jgi:putative oxidoreductase
MKIGRLLLRVTVGAFFFGHGTQKLFGWFDGHGLDATANMFHQMGMRPGRRNAVAAGVAEAGGGAALALGFATPLAAGALTSVMLTAINRVHLKNGPWVANGGYEYNVVLIAAALALAEVGPGELSLDHALGTERSGPLTAVAAAAIGVVGAVGAHQLAQAYPEPPTPPEAPAATPAEAPAETRAETPAQTTAASTDDGAPAAPAGSPPVESAPAESAPAQSAPVQSAPAESASAETPGS